jgi:hypothetical protein
MEVVSLRPRNENLDAYFEIRDWCEKNNVPFSAVFNALLQPIANALNNCEIECSTSFTFQMDFGAIEIIP